MRERSLLILPFHLRPSVPPGFCAYLLLRGGKTGSNRGQGQVFWRVLLCLWASSSRSNLQDRGTFVAAETTHEMAQFQTPE